MIRTAIITIALTFASFAVNAEDAKPTPLTVDFSQPITQIDGKPFNVVQAGELSAEEKTTVQALLSRGWTVGKPTETTLETVAETALLANYQDEQNLSGDDKVKRWLLATKIHDAVEQFNKKLALGVDDVALIKRLIAKSYGPLITGQAWKILDPNSLPK